jgi:hypothetical protein
MKILENLHKKKMDHVAQIMLYENNIEHVKEDGDEKHIKNKNQENQCHKKATKALKKKIGKHKCRDEQKN